MTDGHVGADMGGISVASDAAGNVDDGPVLDIGARADADLVVIAADHHGEPDIRLIADLHVTDDRGRRRDIDILAEPRQMVAVGQDETALGRRGGWVGGTGLAHRDLSMETVLKGDSKGIAAGPV